MSQVTVTNMKFIEMVQLNGEAYSVLESQVKSDQYPAVLYVDQDLSSSIYNTFNVEGEIFTGTSQVDLQEMVLKSTIAHGIRQNTDLSSITVEGFSNQETIEWIQNSSTSLNMSKVDKAGWLSGRCTRYVATNFHSATYGKVLYSTVRRFL